MKRFLSLLVAALLLTTCGQKNELPLPDEAFAEFISAYTAGHISRTAGVSIVLDAAKLKAGITDQAPNADWLSIEPAVEGDLEWKNGNMLFFQPTEWLPSGTAFKLSLELEELLNAPDQDVEDFRFGFRTFEQNAQVSLAGLGVYDESEPELQFVSGQMITSDAAKSEDVEAAFEALQSGKKLSVTWEHLDTKTHNFTVDSIARKDVEGVVQMKWDETTLGAIEGGILEEKIRGLSDFELVRTNIVQQPDQYLSLIFSDPVDPNLSLKGLIMIDDNGDVRFDVEGNEIKVFPSTRKTGEAKLEINAGLKNKYGYQLADEILMDVTFESVKPKIRFVQTDKVILPDGNSNSVAFEAVSLSAVDVRIIQVFSDNVHQFLQVNELNESSEIKRVGRLVKRQTIQLNPKGNMDLGSWNRFHLDLSNFIDVEQGAIYRVEMGFRKSHSLYPCDDDDSVEDEILEEENWDDSDEGQFSYWDYFDDYWYSAWDNYYYEYDYQQRDNPCHGTYYRQNRFISRNILATNLGVITKRGTDGIWNAWITDLTNTIPQAGVNVEILNFQGQSIASGKTDSEGFVKLDSNGKVPFLIIAERNGEKTYMKLANGNSLSLSRFDVAGQTTQNGAKGFIYGERGVWRPGDTLFLGFILENKVAEIPAGHPVKLELYDAQNKLVEKIKRSLNEEQHMVFAIPTEADAATGNWSATVRVGSSVFNKRLKVETIKPNRLKIGLEFGKEKIAAGDQALKGDLHVEWLHGAPAKNLRTTIDMALKPIATKFARYTDYAFDDPTRQFETTSKTVFDSDVDSNGDANVTIELGDFDNAPGMLKAVFDTRSFETAGDFSIDQHSIEVAPFNAFIGVRAPKGDKARGMLLTDTTHAIKVVSLTPDGKPTARKNLKWTLHKIDWRWWWSSYNSNFSQYAGEISRNKISEGSLSTNAKGEGTFDIKVSYPSWGRYLVRVVDEESGHATGTTVFIDWPGWAGRAQRENPEGESMLMLSTDKTSYQTGETCKVNFPGAEGARALVTVENGSRVLRADWIETTDGSNTFELKLEEAHAPNVYVSIELIQPHAQTENDNPMRMYGVTRVKVENPNSRLEPVISMPDELEPESSYTVAVSEKDGKEMSYTLAVVDEGLLGLTRYKTPDPHGFFYAQEALGVNTWDVYDDVIGAYGASMSALLSVGGDADQGANGKKNINRFKPVVTYLGPFTLPANGTKKHEISMPNYIGAVRVMVVARKETSYGHEAKSVPVKKPLMVLATLPRVLGPSEEVELPVTLFAMDEKLLNKDLTIKIETDNMLEPLNGSTKKVRFESLGESVSFFRFKTVENTGTTAVNVTVSGGGESASYQMELAIRNPNPPATERYTASLEPGESWDQVYDLPGMAGTNQLVLEASTLSPLNLGERLNYLIGYPHGCAEQTTSRAFPQLYLEDVVELSDAQKERASYNVKEAISKLNSFQKLNGGFSYWSSQQHPNDYVSTYIAHFLLEAKEKGYDVPNQMLNNLVGYQKELSRNWRKPRDKTNRHYGYDLNQAYRLYTLALAGKPDIGAMNRLRENGNLNLPAKWRLAASYHLIGQPEAGDALLVGADHFPVRQNETYYYYGSYYRDVAMITEAAVRCGDVKKSAELVQSLAKNLNSRRWISTQEAAFSFVAIGKYLGIEQGDSFEFAYSHNRQQQKSIDSDKSMVKVDLTANQLNGNNFSLVNKGEKTIFVQLTAIGQPVEDNLPSASNGLEIITTYMDKSGNPISVDRLTQGTDIIAKVTVKHKAIRSGLRDLALTHVFPSGWEILNDRMLTAGTDNFISSATDYQDVRDDRVLSYFDLRRSESKTFYVRLNAAYLGRFFLPATSVEVMYDGTVNARETGRWIEVVPEGVL
ncbi:MAG: MG2 domain-containing protein [Flavobacteriales bacterium]|nr:MG2 domain-containing protein [Flavobacteriales bacterium]